MMDLTYEQIEERYQTAQALLIYALYEREEETELRAAFAALIEERHNLQHVKEGESTPFTECANALCINGLKILQSSREKKVELNHLSIEIVKQFDLEVRKTGRTCIAKLIQKGEIVPPDGGKLSIQI